MNYLELYSGGIRKAILVDAKEVAVREELNGEYYVRFFYPLTIGDDRYDMLIEENEVRFPLVIENGQRFVIKRVEEVHVGQRIYKQVEAHHIAFTLGQYFYDGYTDFAAAQPPENLLTQIGNNTPFTFYVQGSFGFQDVFDFGEKRKVELLREIQELYAGELLYDNLEITLTTRKGANNGVEIRYKKNLQGIKRTSHSMERITRLYGYGKNGLTIEGYAGYTAKYIDSPYFDPVRPFMGKVDFSEIETQARLLEEMQKHLVKHELPKVSYEVDLVELYKLGPDFMNERFGVGDTVTVHDELLGYSFDARVHEYERFPFEPRRGRVVLANFRELRTADYIFQATVGSKKAVTFTNKNAVLKGQKYDDSITLVDGFGMRVADDFDRTMVRLGQTGPGEYGLALYNKAGARTIWQDAATGNAKFSGSLEAASGTFSGVLQAGSVIGSTITGSLIQTSASYPRSEMSISGNYFGAFGSPTESIRIAPIYYLRNKPALIFNDGSDEGVIDFGAGILQITASDYIDMASEVAIRDGLWINDFRNITTNSTNLQDELDAKAELGVQTAAITGGSHTHGIAQGTRLALWGAGNTVAGYVEYSVYGGWTHSHIQQ